MKISKFIYLASFITAILLSACSKKDTTPDNQSQGFRTTNMFGFPLANTGCKLSKMYDSATNMLGTVYVYNTDGNLKSEVSGADSVNYFYDSIYRLVKIMDKGSNEEWKINYSGSSKQANRIDFKDLSSSSAGSINISYPSASKVLLSASRATSKVYDTIYFDASYNPVKAVYKEISNSSGSTIYSTETNTQFGTTVLNPVYPLPTAEFALFSFWGTLYEGANLLCGKNVGIKDVHQDFTHPAYGHTLNFLPNNINSKNYPVYLRDSYNSVTYKFEYTF